MFFSLLNVFLWKNGKRILFYWKTNILCILIPLLLTTFIIQTSSNKEDDGMHDTINGLVDYKFQAADESHIAETEGHGDKILYTPNTEFFMELMYQTGYMLEMPHESK